MDNRILKKRTISVIVITLLMMLVEIYYGISTKSMALTADGFHMGTHVLAFLITLVVCVFAIEHEEKTKKLNALGGYTSSLLLGLTSFGIIYESVERFFNPLAITFKEAILVAIIGLGVNLICIVIMGDVHSHHHEHHCHDCLECGADENLNYKAAYFHIAADIMTSVLAIFALVFAKFFGWISLDPIIGLLGGLVILKWSVDLLKSSFDVLIN